jgi:hypothetical protein
MIATCLAYLWLIYLGVTAIQTGYDKQSIARTVLIGAFSGWAWLCQSLFACSTLKQSDEQLSD